MSDSRKPVLDWLPLSQGLSLTATVLNRLSDSSPLTTSMPVFYRQSFANWRPLPLQPSIYANQYCWLHTESSAFPHSLMAN